MRQRNKGAQYVLHTYTSRAAGAGPAERHSWGKSCTVVIGQWTEFRRHCAHQDSKSLHFKGIKLPIVGSPKTQYSLQDLSPETGTLGPDPKVLNRALVPNTEVPLDGNLPWSAVENTH